MLPKKSQSRSINNAYGLVYTYRKIDTLGINLLEVDLAGLERMC